jgi:hypothetical protein
VFSKPHHEEIRRKHKADQHPRGTEIASIGDWAYLLPNLSCRDSIHGPEAKQHISKTASSFIGAPMVWCSWLTCSCSGIRWQWNGWCVHDLPFL